MTSEYVTSTCSVGSSHVTPRERPKSWNGDVLRSRPRSSMWRRRRSGRPRASSCVDVQTVEGHEHRRRARLVGLGAAEQVKLRHEILVENADFAIENERRRLERGIALASSRKRSGVVDGIPADEADSRAVFVGGHSPAVVLLLVDPAVAMERLANERRLHWCDSRDLAGHRRPL
jgi:hypothetical protein